MGEALPNDRLLALCRDQGDSRGTLKFFVSPSSAPVHERPPTLPPIDCNPIPPVLPHMTSMNNINPLRVKRRSRSRNGSLSSQSENLPEVSAGYEADLDYPDRETSKLPTRSSQTQPQPTPPPQALNGHLTSPRRRPSLAHQRPSSPVIQSPDPNTASQQPSQLSDRLKPQRKEDKYPHALPPVPQAPPPLSPNRPYFPLHDEPASLSVPQSRHPHSRSVSDAAADQDSVPKETEQITDQARRQLRSREHPSLGKLRAEPSRDNMRQSGRTYDEEDASWEIVLPPGPRPPDELDRISPSVARGTRQLNASRYKPPSPFSSRHNIYNSSRPQPPSVPSSLQEPRPSNQPRPARVPVPPTVFVNWKGEEGGSRRPSPAVSSAWPANRLGKNMTKSMDNLKLASPSSVRRNQQQQLPMSRPSTGPTRELPLGNSSSLNLTGIAKSYEPPRAFVRPLPVQGSPHGASSDFNQSSASQYTSRGGTYSSNLSIVSPSHDPFPRPQSAAGDTMTSPTRGYSRLQSPIYGSTLDTGESNRSPRTISPNRSYHSPGIPGPRPRPANYSDRSDRSSDIQSGPETSNTTPPRTPVSPQSPPYDSSDKNGFVAEPSSPSSPENPISMKDHNSETTLKQEAKVQFSKMLQSSDQGNAINSHMQTHSTRQLSPPPPPPPLQTSSSADSYADNADDDDDSDNGGGTWIVKPVPLSSTPSSARPPLTVQIESPSPSTSASRSTDNVTSQSSRTALEVPAKEPPPSSYRPVPVGTAPIPSSKRPESTFIDAEGDSWAPRPLPENIYDHLEKFFPTHDLDKPVIEAPSGDTSPTTAEPVSQLPPPVPTKDDKARIRAKKSIRIVAQEHKKRIDRTSRAPESYADNIMRKRSTKLWGSKLEEVTTAQGRGISSSSSPDSPSGGPSACCLLYQSFPH